MKEKIFNLAMIGLILFLCFCGVCFLLQLIYSQLDEKEVVNPPEPKEDISVVIQPFNPIYEIDPRQKEGKIFYFVKTTNGYDTIQHGQLENFIINDNE